MFKIINNLIPHAASFIFKALFTSISLVTVKISTYLIAEPVAALAQSIFKDPNYGIIF